jgi:hypothetical protein
MRSKEYDDFVKAYNEIDVRCLSDKELKHYAGLCDNACIEAEDEIYRRGL